MKGLILKDLYILKGYARQYCIILLLMFLWSLMMKSFSFMIIYFVILSGNVVMSSISVDESVSFQRFALTAPVSRRTLVGAKYILFLFTIGAGIFLGGIMDLLVRFIPTDAKYTFNMEGMTMTVSLFVMINALVFPTIFKLGVEKARYVYLMGMLALAAVIFGSDRLVKSAGSSLDGLLERMPRAALNGLCVAIAVLFLAVSYMVSVGIVKKKDF